MYPNSGMFMVRGDSPYRTIADLKGKPIAWGASGSGFVVLARYVFDGLGLDIDKDFSPIYLASAGDGPKMVLDGRTGEIIPVQIFVAVLGASSFTYAEAVWSQKLPDWIAAHV